MVRIIVDSSADFEPEELSKLQITCIPLTVIFGDQAYQENVDLSKDRFYELLTQSEEFPRTSQASPQTLMQILEETKASGDEAVVISLSSQLSGSYQGLLLAKEMTGYENCHVVDSRNGTGGIRMQAEYAARLRDQGKSAREIAAAVEAMQSRIVLYACVDTLEYLHRGGRISAAAYTVGSLANIKPIIHVDQAGCVVVPNKVIGMRKGMDFLCKRLELHPMDPAYPLYVMYTGNRSNGEILAQRLQTQGYEIPNERIINVGAAIGAHVGPNACGLVYVTTEA